MSIVKLAKGESLPEGFSVDPVAPEVDSFTQAGPVTVTRVVDGVTSVTVQDPYTADELAGILHPSRRTK